MMDLVDEEDRFPAGGAETILGGGDYFPHFGDVALDAAKALEFRVRHVGDYMGERGFAGAGRAGQNHRRQPVGFDRAAQKFPGTKNVGLPNEFL